MTEGERTRRRRPARAARRAVLGASSALFLGVMAALPVAAGSGSGTSPVALSYSPTAVADPAAGAPASAAPPRKIVRIVVRRHHVAASAGPAHVAAVPAPSPVAPVRVAVPAPTPAPAPAPAPVATSSGSN